MPFRNEIEAFIRDFVKDLNENTASVFAGAGFSIPAGFVNWSDLMSEIAQDLELNINVETDLVSLAQFHVNENQTRSKINRKIIEEFTEDTEETLNHKIIARLPISSVWTTNYDVLIETAFTKANKVPDVKYKNEQLLSNKPKRDVVIYKMHGDASHPDDAIITKEQYEQYHQTHEPFINALTGELITKTFLFIGFSFTDPNLDYILSRLNFRFSKNKRQHYCLVKRHELGDYLNPDQASLDYNNRRQQLVINDLKRYGIKSLMIDSFEEITDILHEIERRFKKNTIFISGSAESYEPYSRHEAVGFVHMLSKKIIENNFRIVNGFGWGIGSSVINGSLEAIHEKPLKYSESQLVLKPFPQFESGNKKLSELWDEYRYNMISLSGISIFLFGSKNHDGEIITANGVIREFEISKELGNVCIPIGCTGYAAKVISETVLDRVDEFFSDNEAAVKLIQQLNDTNEDLIDKVSLVIKILRLVTK
ncbi:SIR2 family protein [Aliivibrio fischeri]|uniref:SIR2 family protein n=1 Tax=Aliivibrio fischeri TaxID=668 RepID=UPI0007C4D3D5|nr:SIR2 family protein [Aliivibrio fischeri]MBP3142210.1 SIR2 family protein [Aliivibrio fischeri]